MKSNDRTGSIPTVRIGMIGLGNVGSGVYEILCGRFGQTAASLPTMSKGFTHPSLPFFEISKICIRDPTKPRSVLINKDRTTLTTDINDIINDDEIDIVIEVMGGEISSIELAKEAVLRSLKNGKSVVSANTSLIARHLDEIRGATLEGDGSNHTYFAYEAAVCGGIPIIQTMQGCYSGDIIHEVIGICNGATTFMLEKMEEDRTDGFEILKEAQELGYNDPTSDTEVHEVREKISILAKLAFGTTVPIESIPCTGIKDISIVDFEYAKLLGCTIKLLGTAQRLSDYGEYDGALSVYVTPKLVPRNGSALSTIRHSQNIVSMRSANMTGLSTFMGPGSGRYPAANSIVADICRIAARSAHLDPFPLSSDIELDTNYSSAFYIRITFHDELGIIRRVGELAERNGVSICSVLQNPIKDRMSADFVVTTEECQYSQVEAMCIEIGKETFAHNDPFFMPMMFHD